jgi:DNA-directed RNA polymerase subunit N (RpoN/RPB10)
MFQELLPVRCFTCGKVIGHLGEELESYREENKLLPENQRLSFNEIMKNLGIERYCCRYHIINPGKIVGPPSKPPPGIQTIDKQTYYTWKKQLDDSNIIKPRTIPTGLSSIYENMYESFSKPSVKIISRRTPSISQEQIKDITKPTSTDVQLSDIKMKESEPENVPQILPIKRPNRLRIKRPKRVQITKTLEIQKKDTTSQTQKRINMIKSEKDVDNRNIHSIIPQLKSLTIETESTDIKPSGVIKQPLGVIKPSGVIKQPLGVIKPSGVIKQPSHVIKPSPVIKQPSRVIKVSGVIKPSGVIKSMEKEKIEKETIEKPIKSVKRVTRTRRLPVIKKK